MIKSNYTRWLFAIFIIFGIVYACTSEHDSQAGETNTTVDPLTLTEAQSLYEQCVGQNSRLKSGEEDAGMEFRPDWNEGQLFSDSNWYVVESPLIPENGEKVCFAISEVMERYSDKAEINTGYVMRQVVMRNKDTGLNYAFIMLIMPDVDYLESHQGRIQENEYLSRSSGLGGYVIFFTTQGKFVNGWVYKQGEITHRLSESQGGGLKAVIECSNCWSVITEHYTTHNCYCYTFLEDKEFLNNSNGRDVAGGGVDPLLRPIQPGDGSSPSIRPGVKEEPTDPCASMSGKMSSVDFTKIISDLKKSTNAGYEAGRAYTYNSGKYSFTTHDGNPGEPEIRYSPSWVNKIDGFIHVHYDGTLKTFSPSDLLIPYHWFMNKNGINNLNTFSLGLVTSEGTYFLFVSDLAKYMAFGKKYTVGGGEDFLSFLYKESGITINTNSENSMTALTKILEDWNIGLSLMKETENNKYSKVTIDNKGNIKITNCK